MTLNQLECFMVLAQRLNFTQAADDLFMAQPALSRLISALEKELDLQLFYRNSRSVALTPAGTVFFKKCPKILDEYRGSVVAARLAQEGYRVLKAYDGLQALEILKTKEVHLILLDVMMPKLDGIHTMMKIRETSSVPIIVLSAKSQDTDKVLGLNLGADDYVAKPFNPLELLARVKSQIRRYTNFGSAEQAESEHIYRTGGLVMNDDRKEVTVDGEPVKLTRIEYNILFFLVQNKGKVFSIDQIYEQIWKEEAYGADNTVTVHIRHIREKIEIDPKNPKYLKVIWGVGYKVENL